ncbi:MAG TPA: phosphotransferase, partial [Acidimicrobiales bacterium]|nr:phosphotransferase [Acidimicrobiales bacterium]
GNGATTRAAGTRKDNGNGGDGPLAHLVLVEIGLDYGGPDRYLLPLAYASGSRAEELDRWRPDAVVADLQCAGVDGVLYDAVYEPAFTTAVLEAIGSRRALVGRGGRLSGDPAPAYRTLRNAIAPEVQPVPMSAEQSNTSVAVGDQVIVKYIRRVEEGVNPGVELGRFLGDRFPYAPRLAGSLQYRGAAPGGGPVTVASMEEFVPNEGDGWSYVVDALVHGLEEALAHTAEEELRMLPPANLLEAADAEPPLGHRLLGPHLQWASLLGGRTGELHLALTSDRVTPDLAPEPLTPVERQSLYHGARSLSRRVLRQLAGHAGRSLCVDLVLHREEEIGQRLRAMSRLPIEAERIRCHGDYHLGQVLWTGKDFVVIDFEGEPSRSLGHRRLKRPAPFDLAGMIRSFHYASQAAAMRLSRDLTASFDAEALERWLTFWYRWVSGTFLRSYLQVVGPARFLPDDRGQLSGLLDFFLLEKAVYELGYEANSRPDWVDIPARGILDVLDAGP